VEDQSTDSSDLTADADTASVPQGKAGRSRHRLPRQKAQSVDQGEGADAAVTAEAETVGAEVAEPAVVEPAIPGLIRRSPSPSPRSCWFRTGRRDGR
jgi:Mce-associated membrane protein